MEQALKGLQVLDFTQVYSGPYCTLMLADMGAEIIKIEPIGKGDQTRNFPPFKDGVSGYYNYINRNKRSVTLNLKSEAGRTAALALAAKADIVVENFSAGTIGKLGLGYEDVKKVNPEVIFASLSGFGQYGPYKNRLAYDAIAQAMGGLTSLSGEPERPCKVTPALSDAITGIHMAYAIMVAAYHKLKTGKGQLVDVAMMDTVFSVLESSVVMKTLLDKDPKRLGNCSEIAVPYDVYPAKDGRVVIACASDSVFYKMAAAMGREDLLEDPRFASNPARVENRALVDQVLIDWCADKGVDEVVALLDRYKVPVAPIMTIDRLVDDPHIAARGMIIEQEDPVIGKVRYPGNPLKLSQTPAQFTRRAPRLGEHSAEVLRDVLHYSDETIQAMRDAGDI